MTDLSAEERVWGTLAGEAANSLDWYEVHKAARRRCLRDMTGGFYEDHLAREIADCIARYLATAIRQLHSGEGAGRGEDRDGD